MTDLYRKELEDFQDYRSTFLFNAHGQRVLADLMDSVCYNKISVPASDMDLAKLDGARDVIRFIMTKCGFTENSQAFVKVLSSVMVRGPEPYQQTEADTE